MAALTATSADIRYSLLAGHIDFEACTYPGCYTASNVCNTIENPFICGSTVQAEIICGNSDIVLLQRNEHGGDYCSSLLFQFAHGYCSGMHEFTSWQYLVLW